MPLASVRAQEQASISFSASSSLPFSCMSFLPIYLIFALDILPNMDLLYLLFLAAVHPFFILCVIIRRAHDRLSATWILECVTACDPLQEGEKMIEQDSLDRPSPNRS